MKKEEDSDAQDAAALCHELRAFVEARAKDARNVLRDAPHILNVLRPDHPALLDPAERAHLRRDVTQKHKDRHLNPAAAVAEINRRLSGPESK